MEAIKTNPIMCRMSDKALKKVLERGNDLLDRCTYNKYLTGNKREGWLFFFWKKDEKKAREPLINSSARLAASFMRSAACENLDLATLNLRFSRLHCSKKLLAIRPTHLIRDSLVPCLEIRQQDKAVTKPKRGNKVPLSLIGAGCQLSAPIHMRTDGFMATLG